ncbi:MAG: CDP-diacylglycerol--glycerol-3-phosphate 3-phosphatidyltransferase [Kiritimatiellaeota bacterium]|nr:CDP-diacylglycerol--glycerol-3-phosphate 3-phosphatidyltransferase [Kiritimatiellota bacterium]
MNLPNKITLARIVMVFIFLVICNVDVLIPDPYWRKIWRIVGFAFIIIAALTDILDGYIARKYDMVTDFGKLMDPLADKIFMVTAFVMLVHKQLLPGWVAVVILSREFLVTGLRLLAANKGKVISADITGKIKTLIQMIFLVFGASMWIGWINPECRHGILWTIFYTSVALLTVYSGGVYFLKHRDLYLD